MRLYTLNEARELLPSVIPVVEKLRRAFRELKGLQAATAAAARGATADGALIDDPWTDPPGSENRIERLNRQVRMAAAQLDGWGVELKDPEKGLIDFFSEREGRTVYLCYMLGEDDIVFWHELDTGFAGRQPLGDC